MYMQYSNTKFILNNKMMTHVMNCLKFYYLRLKGEKCMVGISKNKMNFQSGSYYGTVVCSYYTKMIDSYY